MIIKCPELHGSKPHFDCINDGKRVGYIMFAAHLGVYEYEDLHAGRCFVPVDYTPVSAQDMAEIDRVVAMLNSLVTAPDLTKIKMEYKE